MHPLTTFDLHRQEQADLLRRATLLHRREHATEPGTDAPRRPPDPYRSRRAVNLTVQPVPTTRRMAP